MKEYPTIARRYLSTAIDSIFILSMFVAVGYLFQNSNEVAMKVRLAIILFLFFIYEPLCTSMFCTIGQKITGIRVRTPFLEERISIPKAYIRIISKILLGFISFFTIPFTKEKRAIHDIFAGSVVLKE